LQSVGRGTNGKQKRYDNGLFVKKKGKCVKCIYYQTFNTEKQWCRLVCGP